MSRQVVIDRHAPELPPVCVATGATQGVEYYLSKFQFTPFWARFFFGALGMLLFSKKAEINVPFTPEAHARYKRSQWLPAVIIIGGMLASGGLMAISPRMLPVAGIGFLASIIGGLAYALIVTKSAGPQCKNMDDVTITLSIPNDAAADAIESGVVPTGQPSAGSAPTVF